MFRTIQKISTSPKALFALAIVIAAGIVGPQFLPSLETPSLVQPAGAVTVESDNSDASIIVVPTSTPSTGDLERVPVPPEPTPAAQLAPSEPSVDDPADPEPQLHPTLSWINVYGEVALLRGEPVQPGDVITAYDSQGTLSGMFVVELEGKYGLMPVYQDDPSTEIDEGTVPGDQLSFKINGLPALVLGGDPPIWNASGTLLKLNLTAGQTAVPVGS